jgi:uncharacterized protein (DUF433 family)
VEIAFFEWPLAPTRLKLGLASLAISHPVYVMEPPRDVAPISPCSKAAIEPGQPVTPPNLAKGYDERRVRNMATLDWSDCPLVEVIPGKVSGAPLLKNTRLPVEAVTGNYDAFREEGLSPDAAIAETLDCYPEAGLDTIKAILAYRAAHQLQAQL